MYRILGGIKHTVSISTKAASKTRYRSSAASISINLRNPSNWTICGSSTAGIGTSMYLVEPDTMVDCGIRLLNDDKDNIIPSDLLITHHHGDHNRYTGYYAENKVSIVDPVTDHYHGLGGRLYELNKGIMAETIELDHTIKCVGYGIKNYDGTKEVAIMGDTRIDPLYEIPSILDYPVVVIECTNYNPDSNKVRMYRKYGHISWPEIKDIILNNTDNYFHLIHPSSTLSYDARAKIQQELIESEGIRNAWIWPM